VLDPDDGDPFLPRLLDKAADIRDDRVALVRPADDAVLHVDDKECGVRPVLECGHRLSPRSRWAPGSSHDRPTRRVRSVRDTGFDVGVFGDRPGPKSLQHVEA